MLCMYLTVLKIKSRYLFVIYYALYENNFCSDRNTHHATLTGQNARVNAITQPKYVSRRSNANAYTLIVLPFYAHHRGRIALTARFNLIPILCFYIKSNSFVIFLGTFSFKIIIPPLIQNISRVLRSQTSQHIIY